MPSLASVRATLASLFLVFVGCQAARGRLLQPPASSRLSVRVQPSIDPVFVGVKWKRESRDNIEEFAELLHNSSVESIRALVDSLGLKCAGSQRAEQPVDVSSMRAMVWQNDEPRDGFNDHGPCEAWIDDLRVFTSTNCRERLIGNPPEVSVDLAVCRGDCTFAFYWLALSYPEWEADLQCAPITSSDNTKRWPRRLGFFKVLDAGMDALFGDKSTKEHAAHLFEAAKKFSFSDFFKSQK